MTNNPAQDDKVQQAIDDLLNDLNSRSNDDTSQQDTDAPSSSGNGLIPNLSVYETPTKVKAPEIEQKQEVSSIYEAPKKPEIEPTPETQPTAEQSPQEQEPALIEKSAPVSPTDPNLVPPENVVDQRTHHAKIHRVNQNADKITSIADLKEQDFIEGVERAHDGK